MTVFAMSTLYRGEFSQCEKKFSEIHQVGEKNQNSQHQIWGLIGKAECVLRLGHMDEALRLLQYVLSLLQKSPDRAEELRTQGLLAVSYLRGGNYSLAENHAEKAANLIAQFPMPTAHYLLEGYCGAAEVYLALWEISRCQPNGKGRALAKSASKACAALRQYSRVFSIGEPRAWLCRGLAQWQGGQAKPAYRSWARSLSAGKRLGMLYEQGLTHYEIGRHSDKLDANRQDHLTQACSIFSQINADHNRYLAQKALQDKTEEFRWVS